MRERYGRASLSPREARRLDGLITELEARLADAVRPAEDTRRLRSFCRAGESLDSLTFEERRRALRVRVCANGEGRAGWRFTAGNTSNGPAV